MSDPDRVPGAHLPVHLPVLTLTAVHLDLVFEAHARRVREAHRALSMRRDMLVGWLLGAAFIGIPALAVADWPAWTLVLLGLVVVLLLAVEAVERGYRHEAIDHAAARIIPGD